MLKIIFALLLLLPAALASPIINEAMPNPDSEGNEWVEIYSSDPIDLSEWMIGDGYSNDTIECSNCVVSGYFLIIGQSGNISAIDDSATYFTTDDSKVGNGLANSGDCVNFFSDSTGDSFCWGSTVEEESWTLLSDSSWVICENSTPGGPNACELVVEPPTNQTQNETQQSQSPEENDTKVQEAEPMNIILRARLVSDVYAGTMYEDLFKIHIINKGDCSDKDDVRVDFNITGAGTFYESTFERKVGCTGYADTGFWMPEIAGEYTICGAIAETTSEEGNGTAEDNSVCWNIYALENPAVTEQEIQEPQMPQIEEEEETKPEPAPEEVQEEPIEEAEEQIEETAEEFSFDDAFLALVRFLYSIGLLIR